MNKIEQTLATIEGLNQKQRKDISVFKHKHLHTSAKKIII